MLRPEAVTLTGTHVSLVPLSLSHAAELLQAGSDPEVWRWLPYPRPINPITMNDYLTLALSDPFRLAFAVLVGGAARGTTSYLDIDLEVGGVEIGATWYARDLWATPVNPECKLLLLRHAFDELGAERVSLKTDHLNTRSQAAIRKLGASYDGTLRHHRRRPDGSVRDSVYFSILATEWARVRDGLERRLT